ncbi:Dual specificity protein phosphatase 22 [Pseudolycoriella hygida]|uniref:Dual specificity protein phosphatase 15 n=1 Tax=Pseudolycoriella hygida TaxID=35572 RepID=A0A9Q0NBF9_9DIPT|nr:Dual specificity protein phosphatase 22 [Pseudolycoriella hygida]
MGNGMNKVLPGLYVGNYRDSKDPQQLDRYKITHIVAIHDCPRRLLQDKHYLCIMASDTPDQNLSQYFSVCNDFIHAARIRDGNVLIHCLAGMSRSVTVAVAYIMSVTPLTWKEALKVVRSGRAVANPNLGFQNQLQEFEMYRLLEERRRLKERFPSLALGLTDIEQCSHALSNYEELLSNKDICEGNCSRGQTCPTGLCNSDTKPGIFRRKSSNASRSGSRSRLAPIQSSSCPTSPRQYGRKGSRSLEAGPSSSHPSSSRSRYECDEISSAPKGLHRSVSTISGIRPRSSPAGLYSYTSSAPPSVHGSRVDLTAGTDKGSAIYLGCTPPKQSFSCSTWSVSRVASSGGTSLQNQSVTPPVSPKHLPKRLRNKPEFEFLLHLHSTQTFIITKETVTNKG